MARSIKPSFPIIALIALLLIAAFLRLYRITELTEFLGDQGRTGIHIYQAWKDRILPLVGPTVLSGEHLGPAFYYLIAPAFILTGFNPVMPAVFTALLGVGAVGLLWWLASVLFSWQIATMLSALWAVSPQIVASDRVLWEPNIIPFFIFLYLVALYKHWGVIAGLALGILVQLHYPNLIFIGLTLLYGLRRGIVLGFLLALSPFLFYESTHNFENILGVLTNFSSSGGEWRLTANILDYSSRVMHRLAPVSGAFFVLFLPLLLKPTFWKIFIGFWFASGIMAMSLYRGVVFDHYLFFLLPATFLLFGFLLNWLKEKSHIIVPAMLVAALFLFHLSKTDIFKPGLNDIVRTRAVVQEIERQTGNQSFSFGLIASRSFSDLHYRFFFLTQGLKPQSIVSHDYQTLFLVCEMTSCPTGDDLLRQGKVQILCYDAHCEGEYPKIPLSSWKIVSSADVGGARLYQYQRQL